MTLPAEKQRRWAYATLGLELDASISKVKHQYKSLAKKWHPDRYVGDVQGQTEATQRMSEVNQAYRTIVGGRSDENVRAGEGVASSAREPVASPLRARLSRREIATLISAIRHPGRVAGWETSWNRLLSFLIATAYVITIIRLEWTGEERAGVTAALGPIAVVALVMSLVSLIWYGDVLTRVLSWVLLVLFTVIIPLILSV